MRTVLGVTVYTAAETAELLHVTERTVRGYLKKGMLTGQKIGGDWAISEENIKDFLNGKRGDKLNS